MSHQGPDVPPEQKALPAPSVHASDAGQVAPHAAVPGTSEAVVAALSEFELPPKMPKADKSAAELVKQSENEHFKLLA